MKGFIIIFFSLCFTNIAANDPTWPQERVKIMGRFTDLYKDDRKLNEGQDVQNIQIDENKVGLENLRLLFKENEDKTNNELKDLKLLVKEQENEINDLKISKKLQHDTNEFLKSQIVDLYKISANNKNNVVINDEKIAVISEFGNGLDERTSLLNVQESCGQLKLLGIVSGTRKERIDPDGKGTGHDPINVECKQGITTAGTTLESEVGICSGQDRHHDESEYDDNEIGQMRSLVSRSLTCSQEVQISCLGAPLKFYGEDHFHLIDYVGEKHTLNTNERHICDDKSTIMAESTTNINDQSILPLKGFYYGPLNEEGQKFSVKIGQLVCTPNMTFESISTINNRVSTNEHKILKNEEQINAHNIKIGGNLVKIAANQVKIAKNEGDINTNHVDLESEIEGLKKKVLLPDQCYNYNSLTNSKRRFDFKDSSYYKCDRMNRDYKTPDWNGEGWYRVEGAAGSKISEKINTSEVWKCGTGWGGHLIGGHPNLPGQTVNRTICLRKAVELCTGGYKIEIEVTNCRDYYVYHLKEVHGCYRGYCTE